MIIVAYVDGKPSASLTAFFRAAVEDDVMRIAFEIVGGHLSKRLRRAADLAVERHACEQKLEHHEILWYPERDLILLRALASRSAVKDEGEVFLE